MATQQPDFDKRQNASGSEEHSRTTRAMSVGSEDSGPDVFIDKSVLTALQQALQQTEDPEGFLGGQLVFSRFRPVLVVEHLYFYPLSSPRRQLDTDHINAAKELFAERFPDARLLGWFSARSNMELGLSTHDRLLTQMFFGDHWQIAILVDKQTCECKVYSWQNGALQPSQRVRTIETKVVGETMLQTSASGEPVLPTVPEKTKTMKSPWLRIALGTILLVFLILAAALLLPPKWFQESRLPDQAGHTSLLSENVAQSPPATQDSGAAAIVSQNNVNTPRAPSDSSQAESTAKDVPIVLITPVSEPSPPSIIEYKVAAGDTLWQISQRFLGQGSRYEEILKANPQITDPHRLAEGTVLRIPIDSSLR